MWCILWSYIRCGIYYEATYMAYIRCIYGIYNRWDMIRYICHIYIWYVRYGDVYIVWMILILIYGDVY